MPDFFADDIVVDAAQIPIATAELPSENFLIHLLPDRNAIVMTVADSREQDAKVTLSGSDSQRLINRSDVYYGSGKVWVAVLKAPGIWHHRDVVKDETNKIIPLQWTAPFPAQWPVDFTGVDKLSSSWEMVLQLPNGRFQWPAMWGEQPDSARESGSLGHRARHLQVSLLAQRQQPRLFPTDAEGSPLRRPGGRLSHQSLEDHHAR